MIALYRYFDKNNKLLYVGISQQPIVRFKQHSNDKSWLYEISNISIEWYSNRHNAEIAERGAIRNENPKYNKQSVVKDSLEYQHLVYILQSNNLDEFHFELKNKIFELVNSASHIESQNTIFEWAASNCIWDTSIDADELQSGCQFCDDLGNTSWLSEGHELVCLSYEGRDK